MILLSGINQIYEAVSGVLGFCFVLQLKKSCSDRRACVEGHVVTTWWRGCVRKLLRTAVGDTRRAPCPEQEELLRWHICGLPHSPLAETVSPLLTVVS